MPLSTLYARAHGDEHGAKLRAEVNEEFSRALAPRRFLCRYRHLRELQKHRARARGAHSTNSPRAQSTERIFFAGENMHESQLFPGFAQR